MAMITVEKYFSYWGNNTTWFKSMTLSACRVRLQYKWFSFLGGKFLLFYSNFKEKLDSKTCL
jgi:hypothetical protein